MRPSEQAAFISSLTPQRFEPYLNKAKEHFDTPEEQEKKALELYIWASGLAGFYQTQILYLEVALRNALSHQLEIWNEAQPDELDAAGNTITFTREWTGERAGILRDIVNPNNIKTAIYTAKLEKEWTPSYSPNHDDIISKLMFGFWSSLVTNETTDFRHISFNGLDTAKREEKRRDRRRRNRRRTKLWKDCLQHAFPHRDITKPLEAQRGEISRQIEQVRTIRNRTAHHDNILGLAYTSCANDIDSLLKSIGGADYRPLNYVALQEHLDKDPRLKWQQTAQEETSPSPSYKETLWKKIARKLKLTK